MDRIKFDKRYHLSNEDRKDIIECKLAGISQAELAEVYGVHQSTISRVIAEYLKSNMEENENANQSE